MSDEPEPILEVKPRLLVDPEKEKREALAKEVSERLSAKLAESRKTARTIRLVVGGIGLGLVLLVKLIRFIDHSHGLGAVVTSADQCRSGQMLRSEGGLISISGICTEPCADDGRCPSSYRCHGGDCIPDGKKALGEDCGALWECESAMCVRLMTTKNESPGATSETSAPLFQTFCSRSCELDGPPCPSGMVCDFVSDSFLCVKGSERSLRGDLENVFKHLGQSQ